MNPGLMNQNLFGGLPVAAPPQIFGNYSPDGSLLPPSFSGPLFTDEFDGYDIEDHHDHSDAKRRRIARACDMCRRKKIKCDGKMPACTHCENYKTECVFTHVEKKRNPPKGAKYIEGLENRLGRMESLLKLSGLLGKDEEGRTDLGTLEQRFAQQASSNHGTPTKTSPRSSSASHQDNAYQIPSPAPPLAAAAIPKSTTKSPETTCEEEKRIVHELNVEALSDMMCSLVTNNCGETRYIGSSSGFSIFSPKGIQWVNEKTGDSSFQNMINSASVDDNKWFHWRPEIFGDIFARRTFKPLPPKDECLSLLADFFLYFNKMFPLFHEPTFMHLVDKQYSNDPYDGSGWWASLNVALAISYRIRIMNNDVPGEQESNGWAYFKNTLAVQSELTMRNTDLLSVQALLGMALFLQGTPNPQPSFFLTAAAIRIAHSIGLHKRGSGFGLNSAEIEQRKRVFWIGYMLDKDICLRSGRPPVQDDDDWNVELPSEDPDDDVGNVPLVDGKGKCNLFRLMCTFAVISSKVYKQLYSVKASKQSDGELLNTIGELDRELEHWKDNITLDFRPEHDINALHSPLIIHVVVLHFAYYNCLTTIHRMSVHHGYWTSRLANYAIQGLNVRPLNPRVFSSAALCVSAARASIHLIKYIPQGDYACVWLILYYPVSALVTLFANILQNPQDALARSDLKLINLVVNFLSRICMEDSTGSIRRMYAICNEFERITRVVLEKAEKEMSSRQKRKQERERERAERSSDDPQQHHRQQSLKRPIHESLSTPVQMNDNMPATPSGTSPNIFGNLPPNQAFNPSLEPQFMHTTGSNCDGDVPWFADFGMNNNGLANGFLMQNTNLGYDFQRPQRNGNEMISSLNTGSFQQPFVPQDLWSMPMTFEWDWADMSNLPPDTGQGLEQ